MGSPPGVYGSRRRHMANPIANMLPIVYCTTWKHVFVITRNIMEARTPRRRDMRSRGRSRGRVWALGGRIWNLSYGVRPNISLGPADGDLLTEPTFSPGGVLRPQNTLRIWLSLVKTEIIRLASNSEVAEWGGGVTVVNFNNTSNSWKIA